MAETIFYTQATGVGALETRKSIYSDSDKVSSSDKYAWLYKKHAYVNATATKQSASTTKAAGSATIGTPRGGGLANNTKGQDIPFYRSTNAAADRKYIPSPHIDSFESSNEGDFGSLIKFSIKFTVYSKAQLDSYSTFFEIGANIKVNYGWADAGSAGSTGSITGIIYNFSYEVTDTGGFTCTTYGMAEGLTALGYSTAEKKPPATAAADNLTAAKDGIYPSLTSTNLYTRIYNYCIDQFNDRFQADGGIVGVGSRSNEARDSGALENAAQDALFLSVPDAWAGTNEGLFEAPAPAEDPEKEGQAQKEERAALEALHKASTSQKFYVHLLKLVAEINKMTKGSVTFKCDSTVTRGQQQINGGNFVSASPFHVVFPGYTNYQLGSFGRVTDLTRDAPISQLVSIELSQAGAMRGGDLSKIYIGVDLLKKIFDENEEAFDTLAKRSQSLVVTKILEQIFIAIAEASGDRFQLTTVQNPNNPKEMWIVEGKYSSEKSAITPVTLTAFTSNSICRSVSMSTKVPQEYAQAAFVAATSGDNPNRVLTPGSDSRTTESGAAQPDELQLNVNTAAVMMSYDGPTSERITELKAALKAQYYGDTSKPDNESYLFPIEFSAAIDGIEGFKFGNAVTTNYLPTQYLGKVGFTITKVQHSISGGDWTTTINTICRLFV